MWGGLFISILIWTCLPGNGFLYLLLCSSGLSNNVNCFGLAGLGVGGENSLEYEEPGNTGNQMFYCLIFDTSDQTKYSNKWSFSCSILFFIVLFGKRNYCTFCFLSFDWLCQQKTKRLCFCLLEFNWILFLLSSEI